MGNSRRRGGAERSWQGLCRPTHTERNRQRAGVVLLRRPEQETARCGQRRIESESLRAAFDLERERDRGKQQHPGGAALISTQANEFVVSLFNPTCNLHSVLSCPGAPSRYSAGA